jgi:hypothetical protein
MRFQTPALPFSSEQKRQAPNPHGKPHERLRVLRAGFRSELEVREHVFSVEVDDELDYLPIADVE